jgi:hypothetical protein
MSNTSTQTQAKEVVNNVTDYLNSFSNKNKEFIAEMNREHRTLQQSFTKLCMEWLENCASEDYNFDGRNEASHKIASVMVEGFHDAKGTMSKPSEWIPCV